ncbi:unnamed protein product [Echinostoma caproni]|uniref:Uncharacterized protein n=1 Tax=Echinostoma caproni TaxID=27848 RepID=A0A183BDZ7_9TREM|nr:unnamed protein product [Echinostoma caproni]
MEFIQPLTEVLAELLAKLFHQPLFAGELPTDWKLAEVVPIHKGEKEKRQQLLASESVISGPKDHGEDN